MPSVIILLIIFFAIRSIKQVLFWIYLWQLKQYHAKRFLDHFRTKNGKKLLFNPIQLGKILLLIASVIIFNGWPTSGILIVPTFLIFLYFCETLLFFKSIFGHRLKTPKPTKKIWVILGVTFVIVAGILKALILFSKSYTAVTLGILILDILLPLVVFLCVALIQPASFFYRRNLQKQAKEKMETLKKVKVIAVTGSFGKTSTKEYLSTILSSKFKVLATKEHQNTEVAIPKLILSELNEGYDFFIVEVGAYDKGTIKRVCDFLYPKIGLVTGVNEQHLSLFGSMDNLLSGEGGFELLECLPKEGLVVVNGENSYCLDLYRKAQIKKVKYSFQDVKDLKVEKDYISFTFEGENFRINAHGKHNVLNLLAAFSVAKELGMSVEELKKASLKIDIGNSDLKLLKSGKGLDIIDSTYSANPDGVAADLDYLKIYSGEKVIVMPCLIELGERAREVHYNIGVKIAQICDMAIITEREYFEDIKKGATAEGMKDKNIQLINQPEEVVKKVNEFCKSGDAVLLEGRISSSILKGLI